MEVLRKRWTGIYTIKFNTTMEMQYRVSQVEPFVGLEELRNLQEVIKNKWLTEGPFSREFLELIKEFTGAKYALLANNGTLGLYLGLLALEIGPGDEVIVPDFTFNASASTVAFTGAKPVFVDVDPNNFNIDVKRIQDSITPKTTAIMPVHVYGQACDMSGILEVATRNRLKVIEDAAQGYGVFYKKKHVGTIGDVGIISFFADKTVTSGEGAVLLTDNVHIYEKLKLLRNQGRPNSGTFIHPALGMNFRMTDLQCAVGVEQLKKFKTIETIKIRNYNLYKDSLANVDEVSFIEEVVHSNFVPFRACIKLEHLEDLLGYLENNGVQTRRFFYPLHRQPCFASLGYKTEAFPVSNELYLSGLCLPLHCGLSQEDIRYVCKLIQEFRKK